MNYNQLTKVKFLTLGELGQLACDLRYELEDMNMEHRPDLAVWFLRNKAYASFNAIREALEYSKTPNVVRAYETLIDANTEPLSLDSDYSYVLERFNSLTHEHYGLRGNRFLDRQDVDVRDALLWWASLATGISDSNKNGPSYTPTPKRAPSVVSAFEVITLALEGKHDEILSNYSITSNL